MRYLKTLPRRFKNGFREGAREHHIFSSTETRASLVRGRRASPPSHSRCGRLHARGRDGQPGRPRNRAGFSPNPRARLARETDANERLTESHRPLFASSLFRHGGQVEEARGRRVNGIGRSVRRASRWAHGEDSRWVLSSVTGLVVTEDFDS
eukprot:30017-Pelagococcus_subviridis.AAC.11